MKKTTLFVYILVLFALILAACNIPRAAISKSPGAIAGILITPNPNATSTPTPFQPLANTATNTAVPSTATATATQTNTPEPTGTATPEGQADPINIPNNVINILLLGSDWRPQAGFRTDVIMLVSLNPAKGSASVVSFPRDLYVFIPGVGMQRINTAQQFGGFALTQDTFQYNFGIRPDYYLMTNFAGFKDIVDGLGGITVNAAINLTDRCDLPQSSDGWCSIGPGTYAMDGQTALWYVRSRHSTSDFDRTRRAQEVIQGIFTKLMSLNAITHIPELYSAYTKSVETNIGLDTILTIAPLATKLYSNPDSIHRHAIGPHEVTSWTTEGGAAVLLPNQWAVMQIIQQAINGE